MRRAKRSGQRGVEISNRGWGTYGRYGVAVHLTRGEGDRSTIDVETATLCGSERQVMHWRAGWLHMGKKMRARTKKAASFR